MTEPTKDAPFVHNGIEMWIDSHGALNVLPPDIRAAYEAYALAYPDTVFIDIPPRPLAVHATHPVDDGVFWHDRCRVEPQPDGSVHVRRAVTVFQDRRHVEANLGALPGEERDYASAALAFYDAQTPALEPMSEPTQRFSIVTASDRSDATRREFVRLGGGIWADEDSGTPYTRELFSWSGLIDPEPYIPDGGK